MITYHYPLDVVPGGVCPLIHVSEGDSSTRVCFELFARAGVFFLESGTQAAVRGRRADGTSVTAPANISIQTVTVPLTEEMTRVPGKGTYEVVLTKNEKELGTANFHLMVEKKA